MKIRYEISQLHLQGKLKIKTVKMVWICGKDGRGRKARADNVGMNRGKKNQRKAKENIHRIIQKYFYELWDQIPRPKQEKVHINICQQ